MSITTMYVKWINSNMLDIKYKIGLNIDPILFNTTGDWVRGGIDYCHVKDAMEWSHLSFFTHLCTIEIPDDAQTVKFPKKYSSDRIFILDTHVPFKEHKM